MIPGPYDPVATIGARCGSSRTHVGIVLHLGSVLFWYLEELTTGIVRGLQGPPTLKYAAPGFSRYASAHISFVQTYDKSVM